MVVLNEAITVGFALYQEIGDQAYMDAEDAVAAGEVLSLLVLLVQKD